eukprot:2491895-Rhodomonas_salina.1
MKRSSMKAKYSTACEMLVNSARGSAGGAHQALADSASASLFMYTISSSKNRLILGRKARKRRPAKCAPLSSVRCGRDCWHG